MTMYYSNFADCIDTVLKHEGGYTVDHAGPTNFGISLRFLRTIGDLDGDGYQDGDLDQDGDVDAEDIRSMDVEAAKDIYRAQWWDRYGYGQFSPKQAGKIFDLSVNMGHRQMTLCLQRALCACAQDVTVDGLMGPQTRGAAGSAVMAGYHVVPPLRSEAAAFYRLLAERKPQFRQYLDGWLARAYS